MSHCSLPNTGVELGAEARSRRAGLHHFASGIIRLKQRSRACFAAPCGVELAYRPWALVIVHSVSSRARERQSYGMILFNRNGELAIRRLPGPRALGEPPRYMIHPVGRLGRSDFDHPAARLKCDLEREVNG